MARQERFEIPCRECGKPLIFIRTRAGKNMPCEAEPVLYWPDADGPLLFYQRDGSYERGTLEGHPAVPQESGYVPMSEHAAKLVENGTTTVDEMIRTLTTL